MSAGIVVDVVVSVSSQRQKLRSSSVNGLTVAVMADEALHETCEHDWGDTGFADLEDCFKCGATRNTSGEITPKPSDAVIDLFIRRRETKLAGGDPGCPGCVEKGGPCAEYFAD